MHNQNPEQIVRDKIDVMLQNAGWIVQSKDKVNLAAGKGIAIREYSTEIGHNYISSRNIHKAISNLEQNLSSEQVKGLENLLYFITKNHSFVDGNKRIAAACFLLDADKKPIISNEALAALTLFIASSKAEESEMVKRLVISILNRSRMHE